jgi:hypothetical protein
VEADSVTKKFEDLIDKHKKQIAQESFESGADDSKFDELDMLLQDVVKLQGDLDRERAAMKVHEILDEEHT